MGERKCAHNLEYEPTGERETPIGSIMNYSQTRDIAPLLNNLNLWRYIVGGRKSTRIIIIIIIKFLQ